MTELTDFLNFCNQKSLNKAFVSQLELFHLWFQEQQAHTNSCHCNCLNEEYLYPETEGKPIKAKKIETGDEDVEIVVVTFVQP